MANSMDIENLDDGEIILQLTLHPEKYLGPA